MSPLDHWLPILPARSLGKRPVGLEIWGTPLVVFRTSSGAVGALPDRCPHRNMPLSRGCVDRDRLVCAYHGWSYEITGQGRSPGNPALEVSTNAFQAAEDQGMIWIKSKPSPEEIPSCTPPGFVRYHSLCRSVKTSLELLVDNFTEVEHTAIAHRYFGHPMEGLADVEVHCESRADSVQVRCSGPQKPISRIASSVLQIRPGDRFVVTWVTSFSPLRTVYEMSWQDPRTGEMRPSRVHEVAYFAQKTDRECLLVAFYSFSAKPWGRFGLNQLIRLGSRWLVNYEYELDRRILEHLPASSVDLGKSQLGRFDKPLLLQRKRMREQGLTRS